MGPQEGISALIRGRGDQGTHPLSLSFSPFCLPPTASAVEDIQPGGSPDRLRQVVNGASTQKSHLKDFLKDFLMWTIFKVFMQSVTTLLLFDALVFQPGGMWDLSSPTRD